MSEADEADGRVPVDAEAAVGRLKVVNGRVHTFRSTGLCLLGADWDLEDAVRAIREYGAEETGPAAQAMGHGLAVVDGTGPVFFETK